MSRLAHIRFFVAAVLLLPLALAVSVSAERREERITVRQALVAALQRNPQIEIAALRPELAAAEVEDALGAFDPQLQFDFVGSRQSSPSSSALVGSSFREEELRSSLGITQQIPFGTTLGIEWQNIRRRTTTRFSTLDPEYSSDLGVSIEQPLLRGVGEGSPAVRVAIREGAHRAALEAFEAELTDELLTIVRAYWGLHRSRKELVVREKSLTLANKLLEEARAGVEVGTQTALAVSQAQAEVARRTEELLETQNDRAMAERELKRLMGGPLSEWSAGATIVTEHEPPAFQAFDVASSIDRALENRREIRAQRERIAAAARNQSLSENQLLPNLTIVGSAGLEGLAGRAQDSTVVGGQVDPQFLGDLGDAIDQVGQGDFYRYEAGVVVQYPLGNRSARAQADRARLEKVQADATLRALIDQITVEVENSIGSLRTATLRIEAARAAQRFASESLETGQERFKVGLSTLRELLELQRDAAEADLVYEQASVDYEIAAAEVQRARGDFLEEFGITLERR